MKNSRTGKVFALSLGQSLTTIISLISGMVMARVIVNTLAYLVPLPFVILPTGLLVSVRNKS